MNETEKQIYEKKLHDYCDRIPSIPKSSLTLKDRIDLSTLLQYLKIDSPDEEFRTGVQEYYYAFFGGYDGEISTLIRLVNKGIIAVSPHSDIRAFEHNEEFPKTFMIHAVKYRLNVDIPQGDHRYKVFDSLKYINESAILEGIEVKEIWRYTAVQELIRIVEMQLEDFKFDYLQKRDKEILFDLFDELVNEYTPAQIYSLIWFGIRRLDNLRTTNEWEINKSCPVEHLSKILDSRKNRFKDGVVSEYAYPSNMKPTLYTKVVFEQFIGNEFWFNSKVPNKSKEVLDIEISFYETLLKREKDLYNEELNFESVKYYYLTKFGVVVNDGNVSQLFTDEKTLYRISHFLKYVNYCDDYYDSGLPYYISNVYSTVSLCSLIQELFSSKIEYRLPEEDKKIVKYVESSLIL